jgi:ribose transport system permease protein
MNRLVSLPLRGLRSLTAQGSGLSRVLGVLLMVLVLYAVFLASDENARSGDTQQTLGHQLGFYGVLAVGVGMLIICGGIDLSIGSVVGLGEVTFALLLRRYFPPWAAALVVLGGTALIGLFHGVLITKLRLQPFLVTLCGLFIYRGLARWLAPSPVGLTIKGSPPEFQQQVLDFRVLLVGKEFELFGFDLGLPHRLLLLAVVAVLAGLFLHGTRYGRYFFAIGANEEAAKYAGIPTDRYKILAYVLCSTLAGLGSLLEILDVRSAAGFDAGSLYELYAITAAVLGGCSLRGGEGSVPGMVLGAAVLPLLTALCSFLGVSSDIEYVPIGVALLLGTVADELLKRRGARRV